MSENEMRRLKAIELYLEALADRLDGWAKESLRGGWSTHQVKANRSAANDCRRMAAHCREILDHEDNQHG